MYGRLMILVWSFLPLTFAGIRPTLADEHIACHHCARFVKVSDRGAGFRRESKQIICCGECMHDQFDPTADENLGGVIDRHAFRGDEWFDHRYVFFADGTFVDMGHFFAAAAMADEVGGTTAWFGGWAVEWGQAFNEWLNDSVYQSGYPLGGNEDLLSNSLGILYSEGVSSGNFTDAGTVLNYLDAAGVLLGHGPVSHGSNQKPE